MVEPAPEALRERADGRRAEAGAAGAQALLSQRRPRGADEGAERLRDPGRPRERSGGGGGDPAPVSRSTGFSPKRGGTPGQRRLRATTSGSSIRSTGRPTSSRACRSGRFRSPAGAAASCWPAWCSIPRGVISSPPCAAGEPPGTAAGCGSPAVRRSTGRFLPPATRSAPRRRSTSISSSFAASSPRRARSGAAARRRSTWPTSRPGSTTASSSSASSPWDIAAGALLIEQAGGVLSDLDGGDGYLASGNVLAGSPGVHAGLIAVAKGHASEAELDRLVP